MQGSGMGSSLQRSWVHCLLGACHCHGLKGACLRSNQQEPTHTCLTQTYHAALLLPLPPRSPYVRATGMLGAMKRGGPPHASSVDHVLPRPVGEFARVQSNDQPRQPLCKVRRGVIDNLKWLIEELAGPLQLCIRNLEVPRGRAAGCCSARAAAHTTKVTKAERGKQVSGLRHGGQ